MTQLGGRRRHRRRGRQPLPSTRTLARDHGLHAHTEPVLYLHWRPNGPLYALDDLPGKDEAVQWVFIGRESFCDIVVPGRSDGDVVSRVHCALVRKNGRVFVQDDGSKNRTLVNGVALAKGSVELYPGALLTVADIEFLACGAAGVEQQPCITAPNPAEYFERSVVVYGSGNRAADAYELPRSSFARWRRTGRFKKRERDE